MTINGFWQELSHKHSISRERLSFSRWVKNFYLENNRFPRVGIDCYQFLFQSLGGEIDFPTVQADINSAISSVLNKVYYLIGSNVSFVFVFDGALSRGKLRNGGIVTPVDSFKEQYNTEMELVKSGLHINDHQFVTQLKMLFDDLNIKYITAPSDGEIELARLNNCGEIDAVISNDADVFLYGAKCLLRNFSKSTADLPSSSTDSTTKDYHVTPITMQMLNSINIDRSSVIFIAITSGDDYSKGWKDLGIHRAFQLASTKLPYAERLSQIYRISNDLDYSKAIFPNLTHKRIHKVNGLIADINNDVSLNGRQLFGRAWNTTIPSCSEFPAVSDDTPNDYINMLHFYPLCASLLFQFQEFSINTGPFCNVEITLPSIAQPNSLSLHLPRIRRGNDHDLDLGWAQILLDGFRIIDTPHGYHIKDWFKVNFNSLKQFTPRNSKNADQLLLKKLSESYLFRILMNMDELQIDPEDLKITNFKAQGEVYRRIEFEDSMYLVSYKPEKILKNMLEVNLLDENGVSREDIVENRWVPSYVIKSHPNGLLLVKRYDSLLEQKKSATSTPKSRRYTPKHTPQKTTLDMLKRSPIKFLLKEEELTKPPSLDFVNASKSNNQDKFSKRTLVSPAIDGSPKKKSKLAAARCESISDVLKQKQTDPPKALSLFDPFEEDSEVSRVLGDDSYIGDISEPKEIEKDEEDLHLKPTLIPVIDLVSDDSFSDGSLAIPSAVYTQQGYQQDKDMDISYDSSEDSEEASWDRGLLAFQKTVKITHDNQMTLASESDSDTSTIVSQSKLNTPRKVAKLSAGNKNTGNHENETKGRMKDDSELLSIFD